VKDNVLQNLSAKRAEGSAPNLFLGAMNFGHRTTEQESKRMILRALELGIVHFDTANAYGDGASERIIGQTLGGSRRDSVTIATKCGFRRRDGQPEGLSRSSIVRAIDDSLRRLQTSYVDIYYLHVPDHSTPIDETLDTIAQLLEQKKILAWGVSNYSAWQILEMFHKADARGMARPMLAQQLYNVLIRQLDVEYFAFARTYGLTTTVYNPLAGGLLTGRHARDGSTQRGSRFDKNRLYQNRYFTDTMFDRIEALTELANTANMSLVDFSYAWLAGASGVDSVLLGPATVEQLEQGIASCRLGLSPELRGLVDALHRVWMGTDTTYVR